MTLTHTRKGLFLAGTDTGVGKTTFGRALLRLAARRGLLVLPAKPVESGVGPEGPDDARALLRASGAPLEVSDVCPYPFRLPVAPVVAARAEHQTLDLSTLASACLALAPTEAPVLVESAGGLLSPLTDQHTNADLARLLGLPVILMARNALGTINHTALAVAELRRRNLPLLAIVLSDVGLRGPDADSNAGCIEALCGLRPLGPLPHVEGPDDDALADALARTLSGPDLGHILTHLS